jgi:hypothetical protein
MHAIPVLTLRLCVLCAVVLILVLSFLYVAISHRLSQKSNALVKIFM